MKQTLAQRFWPKVKRGPLPSFAAIAAFPEIAGSHCWEWTGFRDEDGYGHVYHVGRMPSAHRVAWLLETGSFPTLNCCHKCDNAACVRFLHLYEGTHSQNHKDMEEKGRNYHPIGSSNPSAKLNAQQVAEIRVLSAQGESNVVMGKMFGVHRVTVRDVIAGRTWKQISG